MKLFVKLLILISLIIIITGCKAAEKNPAPVKQPEPKTKVIMAAAKDPRQAPGQARHWTMLSEYSTDLDKDGGEERIELLTMAERDSKGRMMWDDGQNWLLLVNDGSKQYPLLSEYVQLGMVYFTVAAYGETAPPKITAIISTGAGLTLTDYVYSKNKQGYVEEPIYISKNDNYIFNSIPGYN